MVSQFVHYPDVEHTEFVYRILKYHKIILRKGLFFFLKKRTDKTNIEVYSYAD